jgi:hypothetical protein
VRNTNLVGASLWQLEDDWISNAKLDVPVVDASLKVVVIEEGATKCEINKGTI